MKDKLANLRQKAKAKAAIGYPGISLDLFFAIFAEVSTGGKKDYVAIISRDAPATGCLLQVIDWHRNKEAVRLHCHTHRPLQEELALRNIL